MEMGVCLCQKGPGKHRGGGVDGLQGGLISREKQEAAWTLLCHLGLILLELLLLHPRLLQWNCVLQLNCARLEPWRGLCPKSGDRLEGNYVPLAGVDVWSIHVANEVTSSRAKQFQVICVWRLGDGRS